MADDLKQSSEWFSDVGICSSAQGRDWAYKAYTNAYVQRPKRRNIAFTSCNKGGNYAPLAEAEQRNLWASTSQVLVYTFMKLMNG